MKFEVKLFVEQEMDQFENFKEVSKEQFEALLIK